MTGYLLVDRDGLTRACHENVASADRLDPVPEGWTYLAVPEDDAAAAWRTALVDDEIHLVPYVPRTDGLAERKAATLRAVDELFEMKRRNGYAPASGLLAGETIQIRDAQDELRLMIAKDICRDAIEAGQGAVPGFILRTTSNTEIPLSFAQGLAAVNAARNYGFALLNARWAIKNLITAAETDEGLAVIDINEGWPA